MRLGLSSAAAPDATLDELLAACARRGLAALELREGDGHGVACGEQALGGDEARRRARAAGVAISGLRSDGRSASLRLALLATAAGAPVLVGGGPDLAARLERAAALVAAGADVAVVVGGAPTLDDLDAVAAAGFPLAWDADASAGDLGALARRILGVAGDRLRQVRLLGGGPETAMQEGRGVGELVGRLALARYHGALVLSPSSPRYRVAWQSWLGRRGGWGCGSKAGDPSLVSLEGAVPAAGGGR